MTFRVLLTNLQTGAEFYATRRFSDPKSAADWAARMVPQFAEPSKWQVVLDPECESAKGLDG